MSSSTRPSRIVTTRSHVLAMTGSSRRLYLLGVYTRRIVPLMSFGHTLLGLLEERPQHGYELKHRCDEHFPGARPLPFGQVYATLSRLHRDGFVDIAAVEAGAGPDRKLYVITSAGVTDLERWLDEPSPAGTMRSELLSRVTVALLSGRDANAILDAQRAMHLIRMREVTERRRGADLVGTMACDYELFHLEADVKWIEHAARRVQKEKR
jgi:DNA-binding PadR family transcriptional regulator